MRSHHILIALTALAIRSASAQFGERFATQTVANDGLTPRFFVDKSNPIVRRAADCGSDRHSCRDIQFEDSCCDNDSYCYVNNDGDPKCCPIGSNCRRDTECSSDSYFCTRTATVQGTATAQEGCCGRKCSQGLYLCASDVGGKCCSYGFECRAGGNCVRPKPTSREPTLTPVVEGCTTSQFKCDDGQGCCDNDQRCTNVNSTGFCAAVTSSPPTLTNIIDEADSPRNQGGLSTGAKAGIAVGVVVLALAVAAGFFIMAWRRKKRQRALAQQHLAATEGGRSGDGSGSGGRHRPGDTMTETTVPASDPRSGLTQDYFGPAATTGPYTESGDHQSTTPNHAVPTQPQGPGDITVPVEIGSTEKDHSVYSPMSSPSVGATPYQEEGIIGRSELGGPEIENMRPLSFASTPVDESGHRRN